MNIEYIINMYTNNTIELLYLIIFRVYELSFMEVFDSSFPLRQFKSQRSSHPGNIGLISPAEGFGLVNQCY